MLNTTTFPPQVQAVLPILQTLDDRQRFSLIEWLASQKSQKLQANTENFWQSFCNERDELLKDGGFDGFLENRNQSIPQIRPLFDEMAD